MHDEALEQHSEKPMPEYVPGKHSEQGTSEDSVELLNFPGEQNVQLIYGHPPDCVPGGHMLSFIFSEPPTSVASIIRPIGNPKFQVAE